MAEKLIYLEGVDPVDFYGVNNVRFNKFIELFPDLKVVSRGNEIRIKGQSKEIIRINDILNSLLNHYHKFGKVTKDNVKSYLERDTLDDLFANENVLIYGTRGFIIKPKTTNQKKLVEAVAKNDLVFALGPSGTGKTYVSVAMAVKALKNKEVKKIEFSSVTTKVNIFFKLLKKKKSNAETFVVYKSYNLKVPYIF